MLIVGNPTVQTTVGYQRQVCRRMQSHSEQSSIWAAVGSVRNELVLEPRGNGGKEDPIGDLGATGE
jgi:hypothetical protein